MTTDQRLSDEDRLDIARRIYHLMCLQYPDRQVMLSDSRGSMVARSDGQCVPLADADRAAKRAEKDGCKPLV